jgi:hypothetical protein
MSGARVWDLVTLADYTGDVLAILAVLSAGAVLVSQYARAGQDVLALIERVRALFGRRHRRPREHRD